MPNAKNSAKMTGDTHLPDVESDFSLRDEPTDVAGQDGTPRDRGQAGELKDKEAPASDSNGNTRESGEGSAPGRS
ncbi:MAG: hypothetical protein H0X13_03115 [Ramlibacter sp.]|nr:hypothetical protein [Ramlibacter sp.]